MEGSVAIGGSSIWVGHVLQQQLDNICFPQTRCNVQGSLVLLQSMKEENNKTCFSLEGKTGEKIKTKQREEVETAELETI